MQFVPRRFPDSVTNFVYFIHDMNQKVIVKITLPPEEILATKLLLCQVNGCGEQFSNASHLQMHLTRHHRLQPPERSAAGRLGNSDSHVEHFHCPVEACMYHLAASGEKFFASFRNLKQHYLKVHSVKNFICSNCNGQKSFATESLLRAHQTNCGQSFICKICGYSYGSREALLTHTKRKNHGYEELLMSKNSKRKATEIPLEVPVKTAKSSIQVQTEQSEDEICAAIKKSQTTQTDTKPSDLAAKLECSTQTATSSNQVSTESENASTMDNFCQTNLEQFDYFEDSSLTCFGNVTVGTNSSSSESVTCVCTETQTDLIYDEMFPNEDRTDPMLYSHMYTQTCDDDIFSDLALSTIETQTTWGEGLGEFLVSTETQTNLMQSGSAGGASAGCDAEGKISSIQTQTSASMEFLNAISSESSSIHTQTS